MTLALPAGRALGGDVADGQVVDLLATGDLAGSTTVIARQALVTGVETSGAETIGSTDEVRLTLVLPDEEAALGRGGRGRDGQGHRGRAELGGSRRRTILPRTRPDHLDDRPLPPVGGGAGAQPLVREVARWANVARIPADFTKCLTVDEVRCGSGMMPVSAVLADAATPGLDRATFDEARARHRSRSS